MQRVGPFKRTAFAKVDPGTWLTHLQTGVANVFGWLRLADQFDPEHRDAVLNAILAGVNNDHRPMPSTARRPCWIVKQDHVDSNRKIHFQVPICGSRLLAEGRPCLP